MINRLRNSESGVAVLEFALVLPLILLLTLCVNEVIRTSSAKKVVTQLSREAVNLAYRECTGLADRQLVVNCLNQQRDNIQLFARTNIHPEAEIILSYYETGPAPQKILSEKATSSGNLNPSRFSTTNGAFKSEITVLESQGIYVGEAFIPYRPVIREFLRIFGWNITMVYDATVA